MPFGFFNYSKVVEKEIEVKKKSVKSDFFKGGSRANIEGQEWDSSWWSDIKPNMWYIGVSKSGRLYVPMKVIKLSKVTKTNGVMWLAKPKESKDSIKNKDLLLKLGFKWEDDKALVLRDTQTRTLMKLFRKN